MGGRQAVPQNLSEFKNSERMGVYRHIEDNGRSLIEISRSLPS